MALRIIDIPFGIYLGEVAELSDNKIKGKDYTEVKLEIIYGEWAIILAHPQKQSSWDSIPALIIYQQRYIQKIKREFVILFQVVKIKIKYLLQLK